jgi:hypothetical protein
MMARRDHGVAPDRQSAVASQFGLADAVRRAFEYLMSEGDAKALAVADGAKVVLLAASRQAWGAEGFAVVGSEWHPGSDMLTRRTVLLLDASHLMGVKELERALAAADRARAKAVCIADSDQLRAMKVVSPFQNLLCQVGPTTHR